MIERAGPFGSGNPEPVIALPAHTLAYAEEAGQSHIRVRLKSADGAGVNAIAFRAVGQKLGAALVQNRGRQVHAAGSFAIDRWQGEERVQFRLTDIAPAEPFAGHWRARGEGARPRSCFRSFPRKRESRGGWKYTGSPPSRGRAKRNSD